MAHVAQVLPYRTPFGVYKTITVPAMSFPSEFFKNINPTAIRKVVLTSSLPVSLGIGRDKVEAEQQLVPLPVTLLLAPNEHLFIYSPTPVTFQSLVEIY